MYPTNRSQFFKMLSNLTLTMIQHSWYPDGKLIGVPRRADKIQSTGFRFEDGSWLYIEKASYVKFVDNKMIVDLNQDGEFTATMTYEMELGMTEHIIVETTSVVLVEIAYDIGHADKAYEYLNNLYGHEAYRVLAGGYRIDDDMRGLQALVDNIQS